MAFFGASKRRGSWLWRVITIPGKDYSMQDDSKLGYFFLGLGVGVAVGILFAPQSGEETRAQIRTKASEGKDYVKRRSDDLKESATELVDRGKDVVQRQKDQLAAAVTAGKQAYRETVASPEKA